MTDPRTDIRTMAEQMARLVELSVSLNASLKLEDLFQSILKSAQELLECESVTILLYDEKHGRLVYAAATGPEPLRLAGTPVPYENTLAWTIFRENKIISLSDSQSKTRPHLAASRLVDFEIKTLLGVPMRMKNVPTGVLEALNKHGRNFDENDADLLAVIAAQGAVAINNARRLKTLQDAIEDLKTTDQLKSNFLAQASKELRTPLAVIQDCAAFPQEQPAREMLEAALQVRLLADAMTNLDLLRPGRTVLQRQVIPVQQVLLAAYSQIKPLADARSQQIALELPEIPIPIKCDPARLNTVFLNLLDNAVRFSPEGGRIDLGAALRPGGDVLTWVQDHGKGLSAGEMTRIFQGFTQAEPHLPGSMGVGLSIARTLVQAHGGRIWAESEGEGKGATFKVLLPFLSTTALKTMQK